MALAPSVATSVDPSAAERPGKGGGGTKVVLILAFAVFFLLGGVTNINDLLVGKFKPMFHLTHAEANLVQMAFFIAYGAFSIPAGIIMSKLGYIRTFVLGFIIVAAAAFLRSEEHTSELQSLMRLSYAVFCLKKKKIKNEQACIQHTHTTMQ